MSLLIFETQSNNGGSIKEIREAENRLGFRFHHELRDYLLNLGCIDILNHRWNGLGLNVDTPKQRNIVDATLSMRECFKTFPNKAVLLEKTPGGNYIIVDINGAVKLFDGENLHEVQPSISAYAFSLNIQNGCETA